MTLQWTLLPNIKAGGHIGRNVEEITIKFQQNIENKNSYDSYLPTPLLGQDMTQGQFFKRILTGLNSKFSFS